jgi:hypothetical protein
MHLILAWDAAGEPGNQPSVGEAVEHRQFLGEAQRLVQRQEISIDQQPDALCPLGGRRGHQIGRIHQPIGRTMMLVEPQAVVAELVDQFPGVEVLGVGADRDLGFEMAAGERVRQFGADLQMIELFAISQQIEDEYFHGRIPVRVPGSVRGQGGGGQPDRSRA